MYQNHPPPSQTQQPRTGFRKAGALLALIFLVIAGWGLFSRYRASLALKADTEAQSIVTVVSTKPTTGGADNALVLPGTVQAFVEAPIYARTSGYIKSWSTDIGTVVKKGQPMAEIDSPEIDDQLRQAEADFAMAQANDTLAQSTAKRWQALLVTDSVTRQEVDERVADAAAKHAALAASHANLERLRTLEGFKHVVAPFDGVVTARRTDVGALINAGSGGVELFRVADRSKLRVYIQVPQSAAPAVAVGQVAELRFAEQPGKPFPATVVRTADALDPTARTLLTELEVDNAKGTLLSGSYTEVHLNVPVAASTLRMPVNTLLFRADGLRAAKVDADGKVSLVPLVVGRDFGTEVEVLSGVSASDDFIVNPPDSLVAGQVVRVVAAGTEK